MSDMYQVMTALLAYKMCLVKSLLVFVFKFMNFSLINLMDGENLLFVIHDGLF